MIFQDDTVSILELIHWPYNSIVICNAKESGNQKLQFKHSVLNVTYCNSKKENVFYKSAKSDFHQKLPTVKELCDRTTTDRG